MPETTRRSVFFKYVALFLNAEIGFSAFMSVWTKLATLYTTSKATPPKSANMLTSGDKPTATPLSRPMPLLAIVNMTSKIFSIRVRNEYEVANSLNLPAISPIACVIATSFSPSILPNTTVNVSEIVLTTVLTPSQASAMAWIAVARPPLSCQNLSISSRAWAIGSRIDVISSLTAVQSSFDSSRSPITY